MSRSESKTIKIVLFVLMVLSAGCTTEVGSEQWCAAMKEKPKGDWTAREAADYAKHCVFKTDD